MKTLEQIKELYKSETLDGRDLNRLMNFFPVKEWSSFGLKLKEGITLEEVERTHVVIPFTRENILDQLQKDVSFGFEKALNKRGISSSFMYDVVTMWNWILEEGLEEFTEYAQYGLPLLKATALKYGFDNPIGEDTGSEEKYASD